jgi:hypothetical protein
MFGVIFAYAHLISLRLNCVLADLLEGNSPLIWMMYSPEVIVVRFTFDSKRARVEL